MKHTPLKPDVSAGRFYVVWYDWPAALAACGGDEEKAAEDCHNNVYDRRVDFDKFRAAVKFAHSKIGDCFFGMPRVYREVLIDDDPPYWEDVEYWDCDDPDEPVFEAMPTEQVVA